ncbi:hypothetical protein PR202_gb16967 [Eleusine coracana subsp. coracana]|uniref:Peroxidase n=1 Tax=Eleusine coracana subsp. coracana TaxID=191504 RepID=A0AAV5F3A3_ELECO|nr:hypothetical protein PR202_gb16967 [Eleusine coracana subsp. coracana]
MEPLNKLVLCLCVTLAVSRRGAVVDAVIVDGLQVGFYSRTCPEAENVVRDVVNSEVAANRSIAPGLIRLFFHDCFITGCDASILLDESPAGDVPEKESSANGFTLIGLNTIDVAKSKLESLCPRRVSCADILAFAARDAAVAAGLPTTTSWRAAATASWCSRARTPSRRRALLHVLSNRIYGFSDAADVDPALDPAYAAAGLRQLCPAAEARRRPGAAPSINFDAVSGDRLDSSYYAELLARRGLLTSDDALVQDPQTREMVEAFARDDALWHRKFAEAMQKVGKLDVILGEGKGQVRKQCRLVNRPPPQQQQPQWPAHPGFPCGDQPRSSTAAAATDKASPSVRPHQRLLPWFPLIDDAQLRLALFV